MPVLLIVLLLAVLAYLYWRHRTTTLTRQCRWRANRDAGPGWYSCVACGGKLRTDNGSAPRECVAGQPGRHM